MDSTRVVFVLCFFLLCADPTYGQDGAHTAQTYDSLVTRLHAGHTDIDYRALRLGYTETEQFNPYNLDQRQQRNRMFAAYQEQDFERAQQIADSLLTPNYTNMDAHLVALFLAEINEDSTLAAFHADVLVGLVRSVEGDANGERPDSPYVVISTEEEYAYFRAVGLEFLSQALIECGDRPCDMMEVQDPETQERFHLYFDITIPTNYPSGTFKR